MEKTKQAVETTARVTGLIFIVGGVLSVAIIQDKVTQLTPPKSEATMLQSWMTFFTLLFYYFAVTEIYDDTQLLLLKPRDYSRVLANRQRSSSSSSEADENDESDGQKDMSCMYEFLFCGGLRRCMYAKLSDTERAKKNCRMIGLSVFTILTLAAATAMELCNRKVWAEWFPHFEPHYSEVEGMAQESIDAIDTFIWAKTGLCSYLIVVALLLRLNYFVALALVSIIGAPLFLCVYVANKCVEMEEEEERKAKEAHLKLDPIQESAKKLHHGQQQQEDDDLEMRQIAPSSSLRSNRVHPSDDDSPSERRSYARDSMNPIIQAVENGEDSNNDAGEAEQPAHLAANDMDMIEQIRAESIDLRINPIGMRRVLFRLQSSYFRVKQKAIRKGEDSSEEKENQAPPDARPQSKKPSSAPLCTECSVCLLTFEDTDQVVPLKCNRDHVFHIECLLSWADHNYTCPICRKSIISSKKEINFYETMQQRNLMNQHEDCLASGVLIANPSVVSLASADEVQI